MEAALNHRAEVDPTILGDIPVSQKIRKPELRQ